MAEPWTILGVLDWTSDYFAKKGLENPKLDAQVLLSHVLGLERVMLYAYFDRPVSEPERERFRELVKRRARGEPVAYLVGEREFWSLPFSVSPAVLIPRPDTERLVEIALELARAWTAPRILDVGTGSGCVAAALAKELPAARVTAVDVSEAALAVARANFEKNGLAVEALNSDLVSALGDRRFDLIVANLPYIPHRDLAGLAADVRDFEPRLALDGGADGLELVRRFIAAAPARLDPGGAIALEAGFDQLDRVAAALAEAGYGAIEVHTDLGGHPRVASARAPG